MLECTEHWSKCLDNKRCVDICYVDFKAAFDSVCHSKLIHKLTCLGITGNLLTWFSNFLLLRKQCVKVNNCVSTFVDVISGIPQGTVLGPIMFMMYINDVPKCFTHSICKLYADDVKIYTSFCKTDLGYHQLLQDDLNSLYNWAKLWQLTISLPKTFVLHLGFNNPKHVYTINDTPILSKQSISDLGVIIDSNLKFVEHVNTVCAKALKVINILFRCFSCSNANAYCQAYTCYVRPLLEYASCVWNPHEMYLKRKLESVQHYFTRRVFTRCKFDYCDYSARLQVLSLQSLELRRLHNDVRMLYDIINHNTVCDFTENLVFLHNCNNTRGHSRRIRQQYSRINARKFSFVNRTVPIWNILPENIVCTNVCKCLSQRLKCINLNEFLSLDQ